MRTAKDEIRRAVDAVKGDSEASLYSRMLALMRASHRSGPDGHALTVAHHLGLLDDDPYYGRFPTAGYASLREEVGDARKRICSFWHENKKHADDVVLAAGVADVLLSLLTLPTAVTVAALLVRRGLDSFCDGGDQVSRKEASPD